jgi:hypothetical protein
MERRWIPARAAAAIVLRLLHVRANFPEMPYFWRLWRL